MDTWVLSGLTGYVFFILSHLWSWISEITFRGFLSVRSSNAFCFYSFYLSNKGRNWVLICPLISQNTDCLTCLCSVCNEGTHRLFFLELFCFAPKGSGQISVYFPVSAECCLDKGHCRSRALCLGSHLPMAFSLVFALHVGAIILLCRVVPALLFLLQDAQQHINAFWYFSLVVLVCYQVTYRQLTLYKQDLEVWLSWSLFLA